MTAPTTFQQHVNTMASYALQSFAESAGTGTIAVYANLLDPVTATIYTLTRFAIGAPLSYACDLVFEGAGANTASKTVSFILKNILPLIVTFGFGLLVGYPIPFAVVPMITGITLGVAALSILAQKAIVIAELGFREYYR